MVEINLNKLVPSPEARKLHAGGMALIALELVRKESDKDCWCSPDSYAGHTYGCLLATRAMEAFEESGWELDR